MSRRRAAVAVAVLAGAAWLVLAGSSLLRARGDLDDGRRSARRAADLLRPADLVEGSALPHLAAARRSFADAAGRLDAAVVAPLRVLPYVGRQLRSARALADAAATVAGVGQDAVGEAQRALDAPPRRGEDRLALLDRLVGTASGARRRLSAVDLGPAEDLARPLAEGRRELGEELDDARDGLERAAAVGAALRGVLAGPSRYLIVAANNAEMRAGAGMFLSLGVLEASDGRLRIGEMRSVTDVPVPPGRVPAPGDLGARWGWLGPTDEWRNLMASPRFDAAAPLARDMWAAAGQPPVDGVLVVDPVALRAVLAATGPVEVDGRRFAAGDIVEELLHRQYVEFERRGLAAERRDRLGQIAAAAFDALDGGAWRPEVLAAQLSRAARGRHVLAWSSRADEQAGWRSAAITGDLRPQSLLVSLLNRSAAKLDPFVSVDATLSLPPRSGDGTLVLTVTNGVPHGEPRYVAGPYPGSGVAEGVYRAVLAVNLPASAAGARIEGVDGLAAVGADGPTRVVATEIFVARGEQRRWTIRFRLPAHADVRVEPSARPTPVRWTSGGESFTDDHPRLIVR